MEKTPASANSAGYPRWFWMLAAAALLLSSVPYVYGWAVTPPESVYLGVQSNFDDHAVYAAWMKQAQEGRFLFENRFTTEEQPGLTVQFYFLILGLLSKLTGIPIAMHIGRIIFGLLFLFALYRLVRRTTESEFARQIATTTAVFGAGLGWLLWARYGHEGPIDVWQPEAFTFPSLMTNGLFCAALWLIVVIWNSILDARSDWKPVLPGFLAALVLTNIHTYDMLMIALVAVGFLASQVSARNVTPAWILRALVIAAGALPPLLWHLYVLRQDPVFAARAATETFSPNVVHVIAGYGPTLLLALFALWIGRFRRDTGEPIGPAAAACTGAVLLLIAMAIGQSAYAANQLWLSTGGWLLMFALAVFFCAFLRPVNPVYGLLFSWMLLGIVALYYPGLFQRKLAMGLSVPMGILAGLGLAWILQSIRKPELQRAAAMLAVLVLSLSSIRWIEREMLMARVNISNTAVHSVYLEADTIAILDYLNKNAQPGRDVVLAPPGRPGVEEPDTIEVPDLNPVVTGWAGVKTYAGHWSETPEYVERRKELSQRLFSGIATKESVEETVKRAGASYLIIARNTGVPLGETLTSYKRVFRGSSFDLLKVSGQKD